MNNPAKPAMLDITLQGHEYSVTCAPEERQALLAAVAHVDAKMAEIAALTKSSGERLAVMAALNLAHELLAKSSPATAPETAPAADSSGSATNFDSAEFARRISSIVARLDTAMAEQVNLF
ncbi:MAG: cell division protein ZapA [Betaproteobacteria bacterium]|nr:cell division protein ZapA [Betaproteobacteria bacterium]